MGVVETVIACDCAKLRMTRLEMFIMLNRVPTRRQVQASTITGKIVERVLKSENCSKMRQNFLSNFSGEKKRKCCQLFNGYLKWAWLKRLLPATVQNCT